jgi:hypothetical protein
MTIAKMADIQKINEKTLYWWMKGKTRDVRVAKAFVSLPTKKCDRQKT